MAGADGWRIETVEAMRDIPGAEWDALASARGPAGLNPFISHAFLSALEESGCVSGKTGWLPVHQLVRDEDGKLVGAAPCYLKSHSMGEYVFDHSWADALERAGGRYYPKLQVAVPFTPATGPRLIGAQDRRVAGALAAGLEHLRDATSASSIHVTFLPQAEAEALAPHGYLMRNDRQFHWSNEGYATFEDFLNALASRKRKVIRRERKEALAAGISILQLTGAEITEGHWDAFYAFYQDTGARKWGRPYLNRTFFSLLGERMADQVVLIIARREGRMIAGAINFIGGDTLYGRNWGAIEEHPFLHFEVCYYQAMDFAIARGLRMVEAGAQGEHKLARGYRPVTTHSAHFIAHEGLRRAVSAYLLREKEHIADEQNVLDSLGPFRRT